jgi:hypothetical protein
MKAPMKSVLVSIGLIVLFTTLPLITLPSVIATGGRHAGLNSIEVLMDSNFTIITLNGHGGWGDLEAIRLINEAGKKFMHIEGWWNSTINNPLDIYYNDTFRHIAMGHINFSRGLPIGNQGSPPDVALIDADYIWGITLGDEEPAWRRYCDVSSSLSPEIAKYNDTYKTETGYFLKPTSEMNRTEYWVFSEWINEKSVWVYNFMYDYVKRLVPHAVIFQYMIMPPVWGFIDDWGAAYELKADGHAMDCYYAVDQPWLLYETIRLYRTSMPGKIFHMDLWGTIWDFINEAGDGLYYKGGSYEQIRRETWISYLSSIDALGYFDWAPENNDSYNWKWGHERTDIMGKRNWKYVDNMMGQIRLLPKFNPEPEVLVIGPGFQTGEAMTTVSNLRIFSEYDRVNQRCFATTDIDLSNYSMVLVTGGWYYNKTIDKLNDYIDNGGNLLFLGGIRTTNEPIDSIKQLQIEKNQTENWINGHLKLNITAPNLLNLNLTQEFEYFYTYAVDATNISSDYHPIGCLTDMNTMDVIEDYPLLLYHNESKPDSGWTLYFGPFDVRNESIGSDKKPDLWQLYRSVIRAYTNFLGITNSISTEETEDMLISAAQIDSNTILGGVINFRNEARDFTFTYDLSQLGFPGGYYYVHSLDQDRPEGEFATNGQLLSFRTNIEANGTRLFLISEIVPEPGYSIDIFPRIPSIAEVNTTTTVTTTTMTTTTTTATTSTTPIQLPEDYTIFGLILGIFGSGILVLFFFFKRRKMKN